MFGIFKREDREQWTKKLVIERIAKELVDFKPQLTKNSIEFRGDYSLKLEFISDNYADKKNIELNASVIFGDDGRTYEWVDLFHLTKYLLARWHQPLMIRKDDQWEGSNLQADCENIYRPLIRALMDSQLANSFLRGETIEAEGRKLSLPGRNKETAWILDDSERLADWLAKRA